MGGGWDGDRHVVARCDRLMGNAWEHDGQVIGGHSEPGQLVLTLRCENVIVGFKMLSGFEMRVGNIFR